VTVERPSAGTSRLVCGASIPLAAMKKERMIVPFAEKKRKVVEVAPPDRLIFLRRLAGVGTQPKLREP
jgi:hypothetical protein